MGFSQEDQKVGKEEDFLFGREKNTLPQTGMGMFSLPQEASYTIFQ